MKRRNFLQALGAGTAGIATCSSAYREEAARITAEMEDFDGQGLAWSKAPCRYCGTGCGVEVGVRDGRVVAVRGDDTFFLIAESYMPAQDFHIERGPVDGWWRWDAQGTMDLRTWTFSAADLRRFR